MYIEFVIVDNFLLTFLAGRAATKMCRQRPDILRTVIAAALGTVAAVFYPYIHAGTAAILIVKCALWIVLSAVLFAKKRYAPLCALLFLCATLFLGGACFAAGLVITSSAAGALAFCRRYPLFLTLGIGALSYEGISYAVKKLALPRCRSPYEFVAAVEIFGKRITFDAFFDTGNCVTDAITGLPVIITAAERLAAKLDGPSATEFIKNVDRFRRTVIKTPAGQTAVRLVRPTRVTVYSDKRGHTIDAILGLVGGHMPTSHEMLIGPAAFGE